MISPRFLNVIIALSVFVFFSMGLVQAEDSKPAIKISEPKPQARSVVGINWLKYDEGLKKAAEEGKNIFVEFTAKWCGYCKKMHATTFKDPRIIQMFDKYFVTVSVDGDSRDSLNINGWLTTERLLAREYRIQGYPTYWFLNSKGERIAPIGGYQPADFLYDALDYMKDETYKTMSFEKFLEQRDSAKEEEKPKGSG